MSEFLTDPFSDSVLDEPSVGDASRSSEFPKPPEQIGPYRILELLGEGGMGEVYKGERRHPIRQTVAVKIIKLGFNSREIVGRFESERQALAMMDHPGIAKVLDAGTTDTGRPFFVMDYVAGKPITTFCDENRLSIQDRLTLFADVCAAIGHAHTKAIIHRDIKPSNVLAYMQDGKPAVKVIDFGVAKALTGSRLTNLTVNTQHGKPIGTYECMSPEQVDGSPDIDTRTDVYSLGVLLYELLTGAKPFDSATMASGTDDEIRRVIREVDPPRPSTRLTSLGDDATRLAERRQAKPDGLAKQLRGELEWIPLKAMRKERDRRYKSPAQLKDDIQNYLVGRPLIAGPESRTYRVRKFVARHRGGVAMATVITAAFLVSLVLYIVNIRAEQRRTLAEQHKTKAALAESELQRAEAQKQAKIANNSTNFLANIFRNADPTRALGADITVVQTMQETVRKMDNGWLTPEPITEAMVRYVVGTTYSSLGRYDDALPQLQRARELDQKYRSPGDPQIPITLNNLALVLSNQGKFDQAVPLYRESLRIEQANLAPDDPIIAKSMVNIAAVLRGEQKFAEAETLLRQAIEIQRKSLPPNDPDAVMSLNNLAALMWNQGRLAEAEPLCREALKMRQDSLPPEHPNVAQSIHNLAVLLRDEKKYDEAEPLAQGFGDSSQGAPARPSRHRDGHAHAVWRPCWRREARRSRTALP